MNQQRSTPRTRYGLISILVFLGTLLVYILVYGIFEQVLVGLGLSNRAERWLTVVLLVLPSAIGLVLGLFGLARPGQNRLLAATGAVLNALFAVLILLVLGIAG